MTKEELIEEIERLKIPKRLYSLNGDFQGDSIVFCDFEIMWQIFYCDEKGNRIILGTFFNESDALISMLNKIKTNFPKILQKNK